MNKFLQNLKSALSSTGLAGKFQEKNLSADEQRVLREAYQKLSGNSFDADFQVYRADLSARDEARVMEDAMRDLADMLGQPVPQNATAENLASIVKEGLSSIREQLTSLANSAQDDHSAAVKPAVAFNGAHTKDYAFGIPHPLYSTAKRYNRIAVTGQIPASDPTAKEAAELRSDFADFTESLSRRYAKLSRSNALKTVMSGSTTDFSAMNDNDLGKHYFVRRQDALIAQIAALPDITDIFPRVSGISDGAVLTNVLFTELSQAYQSGHVFKGDTTLVPEKAFVHDVMFKYKFDDMKFIEKCYLAYLNTTGSSAPKWALIEWLVLEMAKQLKNEEIKRNIMGCRVEPVAGVKNLAVFGATGIVHRIIGYYNEKKVLPFKDSTLASYTAANIGDVLEAFTAEIHERVDGNAGEYVIFVNEKHKPWFKQWYTSKYGTNANFDGVQFKVPDYDNPIAFVPGMPSWLTFLFASLPGNLVTLENVPGEAYNISFQQDMEAVVAYSLWKSGAGAGYSGKKFADLAALKADDAKSQIIFCNFPAVTLAADATTADGSKMLIVTGTNTKATAITDITDAKEGVVYRIEAAGASNVTTIAKSGKFSEITAAWSPAAGDWIEVYYDKENSKFREVARG